MGFFLGFCHASENHVRIKSNSVVGEGPLSKHNISGNFRKVMPVGVDVVFFVNRSLFPV